MSSQRGSCSLKVVVRAPSTAHLKPEEEGLFLCWDSPERREALLDPGAVFMMGRVSAGNWGETTDITQGDSCQRSSTASELKLK